MTSPNTILSSAYVTPRCFIITSLWPLSCCFLLCWQCIAIDRHLPKFLTPTHPYSLDSTLYSIRTWHAMGVPPHSITYLSTKSNATRTVPLHTNPVCTQFQNSAPAVKITRSLRPEMVESYPTRRSLIRTDLIRVKFQSARIRFALAPTTRVPQ